MPSHQPEKAPGPAVDPVSMLLDQVLDDRFAFLRPLVHPYDAAVVAAEPAAVLLEPGRLTALLDRFAELYQGCDRRAVVSLWSQWYFGVLIPPVVALGLRAELALPVGLDEIRLVFAVDGHPAELHVEAPSARDPDADLFGRLRPLLDDHLSPLIAAVARITRISPRLLWTNAGRVIVWAAWCIDNHDASHDTLLFDSPTWPDGRANPLYGALTRTGPPSLPTWERRVCCLSYRLPESRYCPGCPVAPAA